MRGVPSLALALLMCGAAQAAAQQSVALEFDGGRVTLRAQNAPVSSILAEWAKLGGATIVNGDRVGGQPVTLELTDVPEREALDVVLRDVAGYMLAPRRAGASGASAFDILVLATSVAPPNPPPQARESTDPRRRVPQFPVLRQPMTPRIDPGSGVVPEPDEVEEQDDPTEQPQPVRVAPPRPFRPPLPDGSEPPEVNENDDQSEAPAEIETTPANPFGVPPGSSTTPGIVTPAPETQRRPGRGLRP